MILAIGHLKESLKGKQMASTKKVTKKNYPTSECEGSIPLSNNKLSCAVLKTGRNVIRVFSMRQTVAAIGGSGGATFADGLPSFLRAQNIQEHVNGELRDMMTNTIKYIPKTGGKPAFGIKAEVLPLICDVYITALTEGKLNESQKRIAKRCQELQLAFAKTGIIALVDEATGYQDKRAKDALAKILEKYLALEPNSWTHTFPVDFYREIYRLEGWKWTELENGKKPPTPSVVGHYTNNYIYERLAPGVLTELRIKNPERAIRHHQWFNSEYGHPKLAAHIEAVVALMKAAKSKDEFIKFLNKAYPMPWKDGDLFYSDDKTNIGLSQPLNDDKAED